MDNWIADLQAAALKIDLSPEVVRNMEALPDLFTKHLAILKRHGYTRPLVKVIQYGFEPGIRIDYFNNLLGRKFVLTFNVIAPYPPIGVWVTKDTPTYTIAFPDKYFIQKSNGKISERNFDLSFYPGNIEEKVEDFSEFLTGQFKIRGLFWLDGTGWMDGYGIDI